MPNPAGRYHVQVFDLIRRRKEHHSEGTYAQLTAAIFAAQTALIDRDISSVLIIDTDPHKEKA